MKCQLLKNFVVFMKVSFTVMEAQECRCCCTSHILHMLERTGNLLNVVNSAKIIAVQLLSSISP